ncbi:MAG: hypothetical protein Ct9H300mP25_10440 [Acidobacteriota bacterium]|nr:MAG: hypothetical protein Ct9H300mP25_10440 [Acidobacteriota bacterium]
MAAVGRTHSGFSRRSDALARSWPSGSPRELWRRPLGEGYSAVLVEGQTLVTMYRHNDNEIIIGLDAETGETRWEYSYEAPLAHDGYFDIWLNAAGPGPYSSPLIAEGIVYAVGVNGHFHAVDAQTGALRWSHNLVELFGLVDYNAFASSAVAYDGTVILPMGGSDHGVVAFDGETGAVVWGSESFPLGPGSPRLIHLNGEDQLVVWGQQEVVGLDPRDGGRLWNQPHANDLGLNLSMPVWSSQQRLFISSAYNGGSRMIQLQSDRTGTTVQELWHTNRTRLHFSNAIEIGNLVIGSSGDFGPAFLTALNSATGEEVWRERSFARAHLLYADEVIVLVDEDGELAIASVSADGIEVHARTSLLEENAWTPPSLVGTTLYVRDRHEIMALDLGE